MLIVKPTPHNYLKHSSAKSGPVGRTVRLIPWVISDTSWVLCLLPDVLGAVVFRPSLHKMIDIVIGEMLGSTTSSNQKHLILPTIAIAHLMRLEDEQTVVDAPGLLLEIFADPVCNDSGIKNRDTVVQNHKQPGGVDAKILRGLHDLIVRRAAHLLCVPRDFSDDLVMELITFRRIVE